MLVRVDKTAPPRRGTLWQHENLDGEILPGEACNCIYLCGEGHPLLCPIDDHRIRWTQAHPEWDERSDTTMTTATAHNPKPEAPPPPAQTSAPTAPLLIQEELARREILQVPLERIRLSKTNERADYDTPEDQELLESVKRHGVLQPALLRPVAKEGKTDLEVVYGHRRFVASKRAGRQVLPAEIRPMADWEALDAQAIENLQRSDLTPLAEARMFARLLVPEKGQPRHTVEEIALRVNKSREHIYARLWLDRLIPEAKKELETGQITAGHAQEICRLQAPDQKKVLKAVHFEAHSYDPALGESFQKQGLLSVMKLREYIRSFFCFDVSKAPFDILAPDLAKTPGTNLSAPPCPECSKLAQNMPSASDLPPTTCTDRACFTAKKDALVQLAVAKVAKEEKVKPVSVSTINEYSVPRKQRKQANTLYEGQYKLAKEGECKATVLGVYVDGPKIGQAVHVCKAGDQCNTHGWRAQQRFSAPKTKPLSAAGKKKVAAARAKRKLDAEVFHRTPAAVYAAIAGKAKVDEDVLRTVLLNFIDAEIQGDEFYDFAAQHLRWPLTKGKYGWEMMSGKVLREQVAKLKGGNLVAAVLASAHLPLNMVAERYKVDVKGIEREIRAKLTAEAKAAEKPASKPAAIKSGQAAQYGQTKTKPAATAQPKKIVKLYAKGKSKPKVKTKAKASTNRAKGKPRAAASRPKVKAAAKGKRAA